MGKLLGLFFFFTGIAKQIAGSRYGVYAIDHPGFGLSDGLHGHIPSFDDLADNAIEQFTKMKGNHTFISVLNLILMVFFLSG